MTSVQSSTRLPCGNRVLDLAHTHVMGILNVTPDSFSDGGRYSQLDAALRHAEAMVAAGVDLDAVVEIDVPDAAIIERMSGRRTCKDCSATFHIVSNPPKVEGKRDFCGGELTIRKDDAPETVKARLVADFE